MVGDIGGGATEFRNGCPGTMGGGTPKSLVDPVGGGEKAGGDPPAATCPLPTGRADPEGLDCIEVSGDDGSILFLF
jgi:hypothetical protein